jgi:hypothetical protein
MAESTHTIQLTMDVMACDKVCVINNLRRQSFELGLASAYKTCLDEFLLQAVRCTSQEEITSLYDNLYDDILAHRDTAFMHFMEETRDKYPLPPKTVPPVEEE